MSVCPNAIVRAIPRRGNAEHDILVPIDAREIYRRQRTALAEVEAAPSGRRLWADKPCNILNTQ
jgi:hypothetical protein